MATENARMAQILGTTADWGANDLVLLEGEIGFELLVSGLIQGKIGDGTTAFSGLDYTLGAGVTLDTDQTITALKTIDNALHFLNLTDGTTTARIYFYTFPVEPALVVDSMEPNSNVYVSGRKVSGSSYGLFLHGEDETLHFGSHLIADYGGVAGRTWGAVNGDGTSGGGIRYTSVRNSVGWYSITFDDAAISVGQQSMSVTGRSTTGNAICTIDHISATQIDVYCVDNALALSDRAFDFIRHFATEPFTPPP